MTKTFVLLLAVAAGLYGCSANKSSRAPYMMGKETFKDDIIDQLKATKTVFLYQKAIYRQYVPVSYNLKSKDISVIR